MNHEKRCKKRRTEDSQYQQHCHVSFDCIDDVDRLNNVNCVTDPDCDIYEDIFGLYDDKSSDEDSCGEFGSPPEDSENELRNLPNPNITEFYDCFSPVQPILCHSSVSLETEHVEVCLLYTSDAADD